MYLLLILCAVAVVYKRQFIFRLAYSKNTIEYIEKRGFSKNLPTVVTRSVKLVKFFYILKLHNYNYNFFGDFDSFGFVSFCIKKLLILGF